ncbi:MAG: hypothetical protein JWO03_1985 [Bacteroidetes bacterium]|nr:hypothetical protein [Bacteroidota bacterium]
MKKYIPHFAVSLMLIAVLSLFLNAAASRSNHTHGLSLLTADMTPALLVKLLPGDTASVPLGINDADIDIKVTGNIAVTTMTLNFYNDQNRNLEGQFIFPLAEGQTIHYFAMDVNGVMHEGAIVEKQKGREVFESVERRRVDPGLLEWSKGNNFSARVFPIPSKGYKKIVVAFQQELQATDKAFVYNLPLGFKTRVKHFGIKAAVSGDAAQPVPMDDNAYMLSFTKPAVNWQAQVEYKDIIPDHAIQFQIPIETKTAPVYIEKVAGTANSYYFYALVHADVKSSKKTGPQKPGIIWDVSGSAAERDRDKELDIIRQYLGQLKNVQVQVMTFSTAIESKKDFNISGGNSADLIAYLKGFEPDGGTQLGCLDLSASDRDEILLFSDGVHNFGERNIKFPKCPVYTFSTGNGADYAMLQYISRSTNGKCINAAALKTEEILPQLTQTGFNFISTTAQGTVSQIYPSIPTPCSGYFGVSGIVEGKSGTVKVNFGNGNTISQSIDVDLSQAQAEEKTIGRIWAQKKIAELELQPEQNEPQITALGRQFSIITRYTSLIVLESLADYVKYKITPPDEKTRKEYDAAITKESKETVKTTQEHADKVAEDFKRIVSWWNTDYKPVYQKVYKDTMINDTLRIDNLGHRRVLRGGTWKDLGYYTGATYTVTVSDANGSTAPSENITSLGYFDSQQQESSSSGSGNGPAMNRPTIQFLEVDEVKRDRETSMSINDGHEDVREYAVSGHRRAGNTVYAPSFGGSGTYSYAWGAKDRKKEDEKEGQSGFDEVKGTMALKTWDSKEPYMKELITAQGDALYKKYIDLKKKYKDMPSFYIDAADYLERANRHSEAVRVLSNLAEIKPDDSRLMRVMAHRLEQWKENKLASITFEEVLKMKPEEPQSYRDLGLAYAENKEYQKATDMLTKVINRNWDERFPEIEALAACEINYLLATSKTSVKLDSLDKRLVKDMPVDIRVLIDWDADNCDIDLWVTDPAGEKCLYSNPLTKAGGRISKDFTQGYGPEEFKLKKALPGKYKVEVHYFNNSQLTLAGPTTIHAQMYTNYGKAGEQRKQITLRLASQKDQEYVGDFEFTR